MSSRFHNKYHRHNHHTVSNADPRYPDSGHDPIASHDSPFTGDFVMNGTLSAMGIPAYSLVPAQPAGVFRGYPIAVQAIALSGASIGTALQTTGNVAVTGDVTVTGNVTAADVFLTNAVITPYLDPVTTTDEFLVINVNGSTRLVRLWTLQ